MSFINTQPVYAPPKEKEKKIMLPIIFFSFVNHISNDISPYLEMDGLCHVSQY